MKYLEIDLTDERIKERKMPKSDFRKWLGGRGFGIWYFLTHIDPKVDPLSPDNPIILAAGPLTGIRMVPTPGRWTSYTKSPANNRVTWSSAGGKFGPRMRFAGVDAVVIKGKAEHPVYIEITDEGFDIRDASHLWGMDTWEVTSHFESYSVVTIGVAGEKGVKYAALSCDRHRAAWRTGHGAVWGSKNLKAVVVKGEYTPEVYDEDLLRERASRMIFRLSQNDIVKDLRTRGTVGMMVPRIAKTCGIPAVNFNTRVRMDGEKLLRGWDSMIDRKMSIQKACWGCQIACAKYLKWEEGEGSGPEYWGGYLSLGTMLGIFDIKKITKLYNLCLRLGLDVISAGSMVATLIELKEAGLIDVDVEWGNADKIEKVIRDMGEGKYPLMPIEYAKKYGRDDIVPDVRNISVGLCCPDKVKGFALALATSNRGDHNQVMLKDEILLQRMDPQSKEGKAKYVVEMQNGFAVVDSLVICAFSMYELTFEDYDMLVEAVTGEKINSYEIGERIYSGERWFNVQSVGREEDKLPEKLGIEVDRDLLEEYYNIRGWKDGAPTEETLKRLEIV